MGGLACLLPAITYNLTLPPDLTWAYQGADGGDLITAATTLGIPHPSGYPTYVLLGQLFSWLPFGEIAWRFNLFSAVSTIGACWCLYQSVVHLTQVRIAGVISAWLLAFTPLVWSQAIITEVYALNLFCVAWLLWLALKAPSDGKGLGFWLGLSFGLALGVHLTIVLLVPVLLGRLNNLTWKQWRWVLLGLGLGLLIFAYLPLRAGRGAITWGTPDTFSGFVALVSGQIYQGYVFALPAEQLVPRFLALLGYLTETGIISLTLFGLGIWQVWVSHEFGSITRADLGWAGVTISAYSLYALGYRTADSYVYLLPIFVLLSFGAGIGLAQLQRVQPVSIKIVSLILALAILWGAMQTAQRLSLRQDTVATQFWQAILSQAPADAVLLTYQDNHTFTLWYAHYALQQRPDVSIVDTGLVAFDWYVQDLRKDQAELAQAASLATQYAQNQPFVKPLCAVLSTDQQDKQWQLKCLDPITK